MKYSVKVGDRLYLVDIESLNDRPIIATVEGVRFEVNPEEAIAASRAGTSPVRTRPPGQVPEHVPASGAVPSGGVLEVRVLRAPIPGVVMDVKVKSGEKVEIGQALFVIEAMKMRNAIRSPREGEVKEVFISPGQTVNHNQELMSFVD
jgi:biotin carboxyl carrier protein